MFVLVETVGSGPRLVLVHGSVGNARMTWAQQAALAESFTLVYVTRGGYPPAPPLARIDFEDQAEELAAIFEPGDHLAGHSYGGVVSLLAAARRPVLGSLTVSEPPAFGLARGHPAVEEFLELALHAPREPRAYLETFLPAVGSAIAIPDPLPEALEAGARAAIAERPPNEAEIPLAALAAAPFPKLVVSGAHHAGFDAVCDTLAREIGAERAVAPGAAHSLPRAPGYNDVLLAFLARA